MTKAAAIIKLVACCCFILIVVALLLAWNAPATGYESSIYKATPMLVWVLLIFSAACGIGIVVHQVYTRQHETSRLWGLGLLLILFSYTAILSLHIIRGYAFWSYGDPATHLGEIQNIVGTGYVAGDNFYPIATTYAAQLSQICNLDPLIFHKLVPIIFILICVAFIYLLAKAVLPDKGGVILATVVGLTLICGATPGFSYLHFTPNRLADLLFPMALFLLVKSFSAGAWRWRALFILTVFLFPVFHPVPSVALAVVLVTLPLAKVIFDKVAKSGRKVIDSGLKFSLVALAVLIVWGGGWLSSFHMPQGLITSLAAESYSMPESSASIIEPVPLEPSAITEPSAVTGAYPRPEPYTLETAPAPSRVQGKVPNFVRLIDAIRYAQAYGYSAMGHIFSLYGTVFLYIVLALIALPIIWSRISRQFNLQNLASFYGPLAAIALVIVALYFTALGFNPLRFLIYIVLICALFVSFVLCEIIEKARASHYSIYLRLLAPMLVAIILIGALGNGIGKLYNSPYTLRDNSQITQTEITGMDWLFDKKDYSLAMTTHVLPSHRFADFLLTREERSQRQDIPFRFRPATSPPSHFGYHKGAWLGEYYSEDIYVVLSERDRLRYVEVHPALAKYRYYPEDFERLEGDPTVDKLYSSGGLDVYLVHGAGKAPP